MQPRTSRLTRLSRAPDPDTYEALAWEHLTVGDVLSTLVRSYCQYRSQLMSGNVPVATSQAVIPYVE